ncbi:MAG: ABC transporter permease [Bacteroidia bacterium]|nr:MAG: ABC transporter permease [Bacteroidia bacterium]
MFSDLSAIIKSVKKIKGIILLNMAGLSLGLVCVFFISVWVSNELSYDKWTENSDSIYRLEALMDFTGEPFVWTNTPYPVIEAMLNDFPEVEEGICINKGYRQTIEINGEQFVPENLYFVPGNFFSIFSLNLLNGDTKSALYNPQSIVISESVADKLYGDDDPVGHEVMLNNKDLLTIRGVVEDTPSNSHISFDYLVSFDVFARGESNMESWGQFNYFNYIMLRENTDPEQFNSKLSSYLSSKREGSKGQLFINPLERIYLYRDPGFESVTYPGESRGPIARVILFGIIGLVVLIIALINFINLSTAFSTQRAKEIGVRKVNGASRGKLMTQLFGESFIQTIISVISALIFTVILMPFFEKLSGKVIGIDSLFTVRSIAIYLLITLITGSVAGIYPAVVLSAFKPVRVLRNNPADSSQGGRLRKVLVIMQFSLSIIFIFCIVVMNRQIRYMQEKDLGFDRDRVVVYSPKTDAEKMLVISDEIRKVSGVSMVSLGTSVPVNMGNWSTYNEWDGNLTGKALKFHRIQVDDNYFDLLGFTLADGRRLREGVSRGEVIINEAAVRKMEITDPLGKRIIDSGNELTYTIVGIVKDFHFNKMTDEIAPVFIYKRDSFYSAKIFVKLSAGSDFRAVNAINDIVKENTPGYPISYLFLDEEINRYYDDENRLSSLINIATLLSIIISSIGLFSLTMFTVRRKWKEVGIRKAHGATTGTLVLLLSKEYWWLTLAASVIGLPLGYLIINSWLDTYAYHVGISPLYYFVAIISLMVVTTATVSYHTLKASHLNPVDTLRDE